MLVCVHDGGGGKSWNGWLADRQHVRPLARKFINNLRKFDEIVDVIVKVETAVTDWHELGVAPVGDKHVMFWQHPRHGAAQQGRIVPRHGRNDQQRLAWLCIDLPETLE